MRSYLFYCGDLCNLGDLALLLQNLEHRDIGRRAYVRRWAALPPEIERQVTAAGGVLVDSRRFISFLWLAGGCDIVIGGGQLVRDNVSLASLVTQYAGALAARLRGGSVTTRGLGVSTIRDRKRRLLWGRLLRLAAIVRVRDAQSAANAATLVGRRPVVQTADMAFVPGRLHARAASRDAARDRILVAPCVDGSEQRSLSPDALSHVLGAARERRHDDAIVFVCHDPRPDMDKAAAMALVGRLSLVDARIVDTSSLDALLAEYRHASLVITNRLHAIIFALIADRPIVVIDDGNPKTQFLAAKFALPTVRGLDHGAAIRAVTCAFELVSGSRSSALAGEKNAALANLT